MKKYPIAVFRFAPVNSVADRDELPGGEKVLHLGTYLRTRSIGSSALVSEQFAL